MRSGTLDYSGSLLAFSQPDQGKPEVLGHTSVAELLCLIYARLVGGASFVFASDLLQGLTEA